MAIGKAIPHIRLEIYNKFYGECLLIITMPRNPYWSMRGKYSGLWKDLRIRIASQIKIDKNFIRAKISIINSTGKNIITVLPSGLELSFPNNATEKDMEIIEKQIDVFRMAFTKEEPSKRQKLN